MISTDSAIEKMTLSITEEIRVQAPIDVTFATLLEICGPLFMSYPVVSNLQYRLSEVNGGTLIKFRHTALGMIEEQHRQDVGKGWSYSHAMLRTRAEAAGRGGKAVGR